MADYQIKSKDRGALISIMEALKSNARRTGKYASSDYDLDDKFLTVKNASPTVVEKLGKKYCCCKIIQI